MQQNKSTHSCSDAVPKLRLIQLLCAQTKPCTLVQRSTNCVPSSQRPILRIDPAMLRQTLPSCAERAIVRKKLFLPTSAVPVCSSHFTFSSYIPPPPSIWISIRPFLCHPFPPRQRPLLFLLLPLPLLHPRKWLPWLSFLSLLPLLLLLPLLS